MTSHSNATVDRMKADGTCPNCGGPVYTDIPEQEQYRELERRLWVGHGVSFVCVEGNTEDCCEGCADGLDADFAEEQALNPT